MTGVTLMISLFISCSNDFELNTSADPVPVVWCLLNPDVNEQYVRLERSYLTDPAHPDDRPVTDSTVWNLPVTVYIEELSGGLPVQLVRFEPVTSPPKDSGYFPEDNLRLYYADFKPARLATYRLYIHFTDDNRIVTGITTVPGAPVVYDPLEVPGRKINLQAGVQFTSRWAPGEGLGIFQGTYIMNYEEIVQEQTSINQVYLKMSPILGLGADIEMSGFVSGNRFMEEMVKQVPVRDGAVRTMINVRFLLYKGGEELALQVSPDLQQTTISNSLNQYSNLVNGIGVFSSLQLVYVNNLQLSNTTINELANSELTRKLGFSDIHGDELNTGANE